MYQYEMTGYIREDGQVIPFKTTTPPCESMHQAALYILGKFKDTDINIDYGGITRILE